MHLAGGAAQPPDGGNIDNGTTVLLYQIGNRRTAAVIDSIDIGSEHFPPVLRRNVCKQLDLRNAGIIDQNVQMPIFSYRKVDKSFCLIRLGNIRPKGARFVTAVPQFLTQVFRSLFPTAVAQRRAAAAPIPPDAPVITATLLMISPSGVSSAVPPYPCALRKFLLMIIANLPSAGKSP